MKRWGFSVNGHIFTVDATQPHTAFARAINTYLCRFPNESRTVFHVSCKSLGIVPSKKNYRTDLGAVKIEEDGTEDSKQEQETTTQ